MAKKQTRKKGKLIRAHIRKLKSGKKIRVVGHIRKKRKKKKNNPCKKGSTWL